jgi:predicted Zn-dependent protease with MMP-like domain
MTRKRFEKLVEQALERLPRRFRQKLSNVAVLIEDYPPREFEREDEELLTGLYVGTPLTERSVAEAHPPDCVYIFQRNIEELCETDEEIRKEVRLTVLHELGHHFGLSEEELEDV